MKVATVGAKMIKSGKEFHRLTILFVKKFCLTSNLDLSLKSLREWPLVVAVFKVKNVDGSKSQGRSQDFLKEGFRPALSYQKQGSGGAAPSC